MRPRGVLFDLGGVVLDSPLEFVAGYEHEHGLAPGTVADLLGSYGDEADGPWHALERGEIDVPTFCARFDALAADRGVALDTAALMRGIAAHTTVRPAMIDAVRGLRGRGLRAGALTNIWAQPGGLDARIARLRPEFDAFVESWRVGMRKPEPGIYALACRELDLPPERIVFLDDIGANLRPARALGMTTIKVDDPGRALAELESVLRAG